MKFALIAVQRARQKLALHVVAVDGGTFTVTQDRETAFLALLSVYPTKLLAEIAKQCVNGCRTIAEAAERCKPGGHIVLARERHDAPFRTAVLRARGSAFVVPHRETPCTIGVVGCASTHPATAMAWNRIRDRGATDIASARAVLADRQPAVAA